MAKEIEIKVNNLNKRDQPSTSGNKKGQLNKGNTVQYTEKKTNSANETWYKLNDGNWICGYLPSEGHYVKELDQKEAQKTDTSSSSSSSSGTLDKVKDSNTSATGSGMDEAIEKMMVQSNQEYLGRLDPDIRVIGQPYQFLSSTDLRPEETTKYGRKYLECVTSESPIVTIVPGKPNYMPDISKDEKSKLTDIFTKANKTDKQAEHIIADILGMDEPRYFGFLEDYDHYIRYVNALCRVTSIYLGIEDELAPDALSTKYKHYNWSNYKYRDAKRRHNKEQDSIFGAVKSFVEKVATDVTTPDYVSFYVDPNTSFNESASNSTMSSMLESQLFDNVSQLSKEFSFLINAGGLDNVEAIKQGLADGISSISNSSMIKTGGFFDRILSSASYIIEGGNMIFPELWSDSNYSKDYTLNMTFSTPYGHKEAIMNDVLAPFYHVLPLVLPRQTSANSFTSPFILKAFSPGWFACEMGICTGMSIEKTTWTVTGLPMEIKVNLSIKDLYTQLMVTPSNKPGMLFRNSSLLNFLAINAGVDLLKPDFAIKVETIMSSIGSSIIDLPQQGYELLVKGLKNLYMSICALF